MAFFSASIASRISVNSYWTNSSSSSPFAWYLAKTRRASSSLPLLIKNRGDSSTNFRRHNWIMQGVAWIKQGNLNRSRYYISWPLCFRTRDVALYSHSPPTPVTVDSKRSETGPRSDDRSDIPTEQNCIWALYMHQHFVEELLESEGLSTHTKYWLARWLKACF